jgi:hypothetical protein
MRDGPPCVGDRPSRDAAVFLHMKGPRIERPRPRSIRDPVILNQAAGALLVDPPRPTALALETGKATVWFGKELARSHDAPERASYERAWWIRFACVRWSCCACGSEKNRAFHGDPMNAPASGREEVRWQ